jgi:transcriptional regulator with XRE-family HTH domain
MENINMGEKLKKLRISKKLTQKQVADRLGIAVSTLSGYELEEKHPSYFTLMKLARLYNVSTDYLIGMTDKRNLDVTGLDEREIEVINEMISLLKRKTDN